MGALGVTGDVNEVDDLCAIDGIHAGGFRADADFDGETARRLNIKVDPPLEGPAQAGKRWPVSCQMVLGRVPQSALRLAPDHWLPILVPGCLTAACAPGLSR